MRRNRRTGPAAWALLVAAAPCLAGAADGIELSVGEDPATRETMLAWTGGRPDYAVHRSPDPGTAADPDRLVALTSSSTWVAGLERPLPGEVFHYLVVETDLAAGTFPEAWINGERCPAEPAIQVHAYNPDTYILRQSLCTNFEGPFIYLLFGRDKVLMQDTGATASLPLATTVYGIIDQWLLDNGRTSIELEVTHSHAHGDHVAGDAQFQGQPNTVVVGLGPSAVASFFGITDWPNETVAHDLGGGRVIDVVPIPGHQASHVALYDRRTGLVLTGDTLYPGRCYISAFSQYQASLHRIVDFLADRFVVHVLGTHIEMTSTPYVDFPFGATYHPDEHELQLARSHLLELRDAVDAMAPAPFIEPYPDFIVYPF